MHFKYSIAIYAAGYLPWQVVFLHTKKFMGNDSVRSETFSRINI